MKVLKDKISLSEMLSEIEFDYEWGIDEEGQNCIKLIDEQCANLGDIESECFYDAEDVIDRMNIYWNDYTISYIDNWLESKGIEVDSDDWESLYKTIGEIETNEIDEDYTILHFIIDPTNVFIDKEFENARQ